ncbi:MAG: ATP phosphoribosyltransferase regulatory subunit [Anaerolineae bacterium]|nr:ATP phosphoribosyltransferase regulatory subunit [Anaerolineae bacterium]
MVTVWDGRLPHGVADIFGVDAARHIALRRALRDVFTSWAYQEVIPPTFEYADTQAAELSPQLREEMYRFVDRDGRALALRADLTVATARIVGTRLYDQPLPLRLFYVGHVFRHEEPRAGRRREFTQAGIELVGAGSAEADAEVLAIAMTALQRAQLPRFQLNVGHSGWFRALLASVAIGDAAGERLRIAVDRKSSAALAEAADSLPLSEPVRAALLATPGLSGGPEVLQRAASLAPNAEAQEAIARLEQVYARLTHRGLADYVALDLGEVRGMQYYTGIRFEAFAPGLGVPLCTGGRYDGLLAHFGPSLPAVGFALELERLLLALSPYDLPSVTNAPHVVAAAGAPRAAWSLLQAARGRGWRIEEDVLGRDRQALLAHARGRGAQTVWWWDGEDAVQVIAGVAVRRLTLAELARELERAPEPGGSV